MPAPTLESLGDTADILRRLWAGETVRLRRPARALPRAAARRSVPTSRRPPCSSRRSGPSTLGLAGRSFDGVILHPFLTPDAVRRSVDIVRDAAADAGRDPGALRCYATVVVAPDRAPGDIGLAVGARAAGYFHVSGLRRRAGGRQRMECRVTWRAYRDQPLLRASAALGRQERCRVTS